MKTILIKNGILVTMDKQRRIIEDGAVAIEKNKIVGVGKTREITNNFKGDVVIDAKRKAILPGFVNTHTHAATVYLKGVTEDMPNALHKVLWPIKHLLTPDILYDMGMLGMLELLKSGSTTVAENYNLLRMGGARASEKIGLRMLLSEQVIDVDLTKIDGGIKDGLYTYDDEIGDRTLEEAVKLIKEWNEKAEGRIRCMMGPLATDVCSKEILEKARIEAEKLGVGLTIHCSQSPAEVKQVNKMYGKSPVQFLKDIGYLGQKLIATHCIYTSREDTKTLADSGTKIAHCPSNMIIRGGNKMAPQLHWFESGITFGLGTDNPPSPHDMFVAMRSMRSVANRNLSNNEYESGLTKFFPNSMKTLEVATIGGAKVLGMEDKIGSIEVGKFADIITVNIKNPHIGPTNNGLVTNIVNYMNGSDVEDVIIDGYLVKERGTVKTVNEAEVVDKAYDTNQSLWTKFYEEYPELKQ